MPFDFVYQLVATIRSRIKTLIGAVRRRVLPEQEYSRIWEAIQPIVPSNASPKVEATVRSLEILPGLRRWVPKPNMIEILSVLS
jgi:hypothetical protein